MEFEVLRPFISGALGGVLAVGLCALLRRWVPEVCGIKSARILVEENRLAIWLANGCFALGFVCAFVLYSRGIFATSDWRGFAIGVGGGSVLTILTLFIVPLLLGRRPKEALVAFSISHSTPIILLYGILFVAVVAFAVASASVGVLPIAIMK
ncbi:hypothetical protein [Massilia sp. METH4]|uniref:hypothetical protein n=1 Tax=Massilia sp. METH4 TaxID=3123041 RepID=UPI0030CD2364